MHMYIPMYVSMYVSMCVSMYVFRVSPLPIAKTHKGILPAQTTAPCEKTIAFLAQPQRLEIKVVVAMVVVV
jgi:hypothetical protein